MLSYHGRLWFDTHRIHISDDLVGQQFHLCGNRCKRHNAVIPWTRALILVKNINTPAVPDKVALLVILARTEIFGKLCVDIRDRGVAGNHEFVSEVRCDLVYVDTARLNPVCGKESCYNLVRSKSVACTRPNVCA